MHRRLLPIVLLMLGYAQLSLAAIHVSPTGSASAAGSQEHPTSLTAAVEKAHRDDGISEIILQEGYYAFDSTLRVHALMRPDGSPLILRSSSPDRPAVIRGGRSLGSLWRSPDSRDPIVARMPSSARSQVRVADLRAAGLTNYGRLRRRGFDWREAAPGELFVEGQRQIIAGYPNPGQSAGNSADRSGIENGFQKYANASGSSVDLPDGLAARWSQAKDLWAHGYWGSNWADAHLPVASVNGNRLSLGSQPSMGISGDGAYRVYNLPEELDMPGEWYLHRDTGKLYFWPRSSGDLSATSFSMTEGATVEVLRSSNLVFQDIVFESGRSDLVQVRDSTAVFFRRCVFRGSGEMGLRLDGERNRVEASLFHDIGDAAVVITGGAQKTLFPGANLAVDNVIHDYGQIYLAYSAGVYLDGIGNVAAHNLIYDAPHQAIQINGALSRVYRNEIHSVCQFVDDGGAIYSGRNFLGWGNEIVENFVHDIATDRTAENWVHGLYLDDFASGFEVRGNVFEKIQAFAMNLGGGRHNVLDGNLVLDSRGGHLNDNRGARWIDTTRGSWWNMVERISAVDRFSDPWKSVFPGLAKVPSGLGAMAYVYPDGSEFTRNAGSGVTTWTHGEDWTSQRAGVFSHYARFDGTRHDASVSSGANLASRGSRSDISLNTGGITIPFSRIGLQDDSWRRPRTTQSSALANFTWSRGTVYAGAPLTLFADSSWSPSGDRVVSRTWSVNGQQVGTGERLRWTPPTARSYRVSLRVATASGAVDETERVLVVRSSSERPRTWLSEAFDAPGRIQAEYFDRSRYFDSDDRNHGGTLRQSGVDIGRSGSTTYVGWTQPEEWLEYTVKAAPGSYDLYVRAASRLDGVALAAEWDGRFVAGIMLPNVGNNMHFQRHRVGRINVPVGGLHTLRLISLGKDFNLDYLELERVGDASRPDTSDPVDVTDPTDVDEAPEEDSGDHNSGGQPEIPSGLTMGSMAVARYDDIRGAQLESLFDADKFPASPDHVEERGSFDFVGSGDQFGIYAWAWLVPETTGDYTFWLASDDQGTLSLSTDRDSTKAKVIAQVAGHTSPQQFDKDARQRSATVRLEAGKAYYMETLVKQVWGNVHLSVAWQGPGFGRQIIPGRVLGLASSEGPDTTDSAGGGDDSGSSGELTQRLNVAIYRGLRGDLLGTLYDSSAFPDRPDATDEISEFSYLGSGDNYGLYAWGWLTPERTGDYTFWISSDNQGELFLSSGSSADRARVIAQVSRYTNFESFDQYSEQRSATIRLEAGKRYYIAGAMKEGWGGDHLSVAWQGPGFSREIIPGNVLTSTER